MRSAEWRSVYIQVIESTLFTRPLVTFIQNTEYIYIYCHVVFTTITRTINWPMVLFVSRRYIVKRMTNKIRSDWVVVQRTGDDLILLWHNDSLFMGTIWNKCRDAIILGRAKGKFQGVNNWYGDFSDFISKAMQRIIQRIHWTFSKGS